MTFIARVKKIDTAALRTHRAFPLVVIGWLVLVFGAAAYIVNAGLLYALLGAITGALLGRYLVTRFDAQPVGSKADDRSETERDKRLKRVLGPETDQPDESETSFEQIDEDDPDADLARILSSQDRRSGPEPIVEPAALEIADGAAAEHTPQFVTLEELQLEAPDEANSAKAPDEVDGPVDEVAERTEGDPAEDASDDDGSDDDWPAHAPEWSDPGAVLASMHDSDETGTVDWDSYASDVEPDNGRDAYDGWTFESTSDATEAGDAEPVTDGIDPEFHEHSALEVVHGLVSAEPYEPPQPVAEPGENAAAKLRSQDLSQMSLVQMIERLAFAMEDYREARQDIASPVAGGADAEIAEALRALPALTRAAGAYATDGNAALDLSTREEAEATEEALREALEKLQKLSGGAG